MWGPQLVIISHNLSIAGRVALSQGNNTIQNSRTLIFACGTPICFIYGPAVKVSIVYNTKTTYYSPSVDGDGGIVIVSMSARWWSCLTQSTAAPK